MFYFSRFARKIIWLTPFNMSTGKEIYIIDAHGFLHRNYHALPKLATSKGEEVGALYGFLNWILRFLKARKPAYVAVCFDSKGPTFRHEAFKEYKANRPPTEEALVSQLKIAREVVSALGLKMLALAGAEADDLMACAAQCAKGAGARSVIVSLDKDIYQIVSDDVLLWDGQPKDEPKGAKACVEKFGVPCTHMTDYLALLGDSSDNVPGVSGIGAKTAKELVNSYGHLDRIFEEANKQNSSLKPALAKKLKEGEQRAKLSYGLVTLKTDILGELNFEEFGVRPPQMEVARAMAKRFEFKNLDIFLDACQKTAQHNQPFYEQSAQTVLPQPASDTQPPAPAPAAEGELKRQQQGELFDFEALESKKPSLSDKGAGAAQNAAFLSGAQNGGAKEGQAARAVHDSQDAKERLLRLLKNAQSAGEAFIFCEEGHLIFGFSALDFVIMPLSALDEVILRQIYALIYDDDICKIGYDLKYTLRVLGYEPSGKTVRCEDLALARYCLDPSSDFTLSGALAQVLNVMISPVVSLSQKLDIYARQIWALRPALQNLLKEQNAEEVYKTLELPLMSILLEMETFGIMVDFNWLKVLDILFSKEIQDAQTQVNKIAGEQININSPKQLGVLLYDKLKLPVYKKTKTGYSTDEEALETLTKLHPVAEQILKFREAAKLKSTYVDVLLNSAEPKTRRVHTNFNQTGTVTGRLSSFSPNLQNIPVRTEKGRLIRQAFVAGEGKVLLSADYSQIDLRVLADRSCDETLIHAFKNTDDIHTRTASEVFNVPVEEVSKEMRTRAKAINFGIVYGQGPMALSESLDITPSEAKDYIDAYFARYDTLKEWINKTAVNARRAGFVKTMLGHIRYLPEFEASSPRLASFAARAAVNTVVQGGSSDIIKKAMIDIYRAADKPQGLKMLLQVHDELIFEVPQENLKAASLWVKEKMEQAVKLKVPLLAQAKAGKNWNEMGPVI